jgi:hypothetical protein
MVMVFAFCFAGPHLESCANTEVDHPFQVVAVAASHPLRGMSGHLSG